jgi:hypothetical protein
VVIKPQDVRNLYFLIRSDTLVQFFGEIQLRQDESGNLSPSCEGAIVIGKKITCRQVLPVHVSQKLSIVSRNCNFNSFKPSHLGEWLRYLYTQLFNGIHFVCLQDFPTDHVDSLAAYGHVIHQAYAVGQNGKLISNVIIMNPGVITSEELDNCNIFYLPEKSNLSYEFISGSLVIDFPSKKISIGSVYGSFATKVEWRKSEMENRAAWIRNHKTKTGSDILLCGVFNPRTLSFVTDEAPLLKTKYASLNTLVYYIRLIPFLVLSLVGINSIKELQANSHFGLVFPRTSTMKNKKIFGITIPFENMGCVMDLVQTNLDPESVDIDVFIGDNLSAHYPIRVKIK